MISFIVTARNESPPVLAATIDSLLATSAAHAREIILVDDSSDPPVELDRPDLRILRNTWPTGVAQSRRCGAALASGDILVFTDAHMRFAPDWLEQMLAHVDSGALLCASWWDWEMTRPLCYGGEFLWCAERDYHAGRTPGLTFRHLTRFPGAGAVDVPMVIGACYMILRCAYDRLGGFSPFFRVWGKSEQDISARAWITGVGARCVTGARVAHLSRKQFPYPVRWEEIEFNQAAMARTVFAEPVARRMEEMLRPLPNEVETWLAEADFTAWRAQVQSRRRLTDAEFFRRFVPNAPECFTREEPPPLP
ncbi:MAG TPA: glycosyltransferase [Bryobacteraceae bacterium]|nr:glycosyltransferase [Bryobacteraceae bacterium]